MRCLVRCAQQPPPEKVRLMGKFQLAPPVARVYFENDVMSDRSQIAETEDANVEATDNVREGTVPESFGALKRLAPEGSSISRSISRAALRMYSV